jgi:hypothetical protein
LNRPCYSLNFSLRSGSSEFRIRVECLRVGEDQAVEVSSPKAPYFNLLLIISRFIFTIEIYGSLPYLPAHWYAISRIDGIIISFTSYSSICHMHDPNGYRSVKNQKSVKSTDFFFLIISWTPPQCRVVLSSVLLAWMLVEGKILCSGPLYVSPNIYHTKITQYLL